VVGAKMTAGDGLTTKLAAAAFSARSLTTESEDVEMDWVKVRLKLMLGCSALCLCALGGVMMIYGQSQAKLKLPQTKQLIAVTTPDWNAVSGMLQRYERTSSNALWRPVGVQIPIVVGRNGLAWGRGLHGEPATLAQGTDPLKREGDGKAPAGAFKLTAAFGYAPPAQARRIKLPYLPASQTVQCVDDSQSVYYNQVVDRAQIKAPDWQSHEEMRRKDELYRWGIVVEHNAGSVSNQRGHAQPSGGSCIFPAYLVRRRARHGGLYSDGSEVDGRSFVLARRAEAASTSATAGARVYAFADGVAFAC
jgi:D-alanyl-D-alanine dipeptidase